MMMIRHSVVKMKSLRNLTWPLHDRCTFDECRSQSSQNNRQFHAATRFCVCVVYVLCMWLFEISRLDSAWQTTTVPWKVLWRLLFLSNRTSFNQFHIKWTHFWCTDSITYFFFITSEQKSSFEKRFKKNWKEQYTSIIKNNDKKQN